MGRTVNVPAVLPIRNTSATLISTNPIFKIGQAIIETDTNRNKLGNGVSTYTQLAYSNWGIDLINSTGIDTYIAIANPMLISYFSELAIITKFTSANTGASTINLNSLGAKAIKKNVSIALGAGDITAGGCYLLVYDGTNFQLITRY